MAKKKLIDFFGILSEKEGEGMLKDLKKARALNLKLTKERIKRIKVENY